MKRASAVAHSNIALVKYWGKADSARNLPAVPSLSFTLDRLTTTTSVEFDASLDEDLVELDGREVGGRERARVVELLNRLRQRAQTELRARVHSSNDFPTAAGLASSASGFAALAVAGAGALQCALPVSELSSLARQSSASAARSLYGGFVSLAAGAESAVQLAPEDHWDLRLLVAVTDAGRKAIGSTEAMQTTRKTSPYYSAWVEHSPVLYREGETAVRQRDFRALGECMEQSTLMMHASMFAARPGIVFFSDATLGLIRAVRRLREAGLECYFTIDAGPHVKVLVESQHAEALSRELAAHSAVQQVINCGAGPGAHLLES